MDDGFQEVSFSRILRSEQIQQFQKEDLVNVFSRQFGRYFSCDDNSQ